MYINPDHGQTSPISNYIDNNGSSPGDPGIYYENQGNGGDNGGVQPAPNLAPLPLNNEDELLIINPDIV